MNLSEFDISNPYAVTLLASECITPPESEDEVRHLVLQLPSQGFDFVEGQSIGVLVPGPHEFGNRHHLRLYSIASPREGEHGRVETISLCVRRCFYFDDISGERYPGKASNYLCDARPGDSIQITGPYGSRFSVPSDENCNLLMVGAGTGIAPFRAFVNHIYQYHGGWKGKVRLFYGAKTGMELLYLNDFRKDLGLYYDDQSFRAFAALSPRPLLDVPPALDRVLAENAGEVWDLVEDSQTHVYVAGLIGAKQKFDQAMLATAGPGRSWRDTCEHLIAESRYSELLYE